MSDIKSLNVEFLPQHARVTVTVPAGAGEVHALQAYVAYRLDSERPNVEAFLGALEKVLSAAELHLPPKAATLRLIGLDGL